MPDARRIAVAGFVILLVPLGGEVGALMLSVIVAALLTVLAVWELRAPGIVKPTARPTWRSPAAKRS